MPRAAVGRRGDGLYRTASTRSAPAARRADYRRPASVLPAPLAGAAAILTAALIACPVITSPLTRSRLDGELDRAGVAAIAAGARSSSIRRRWRAWPATAPCWRRSSARARRCTGSAPASGRWSPTRSRPSSSATSRSTCCAATPPGPAPICPAECVRGGDGGPRQRPAARPLGRAPAGRGADRRAAQQPASCPACRGPDRWAPAATWRPRPTPSCPCSARARLTGPTGRWSRGAQALAALGLDAARAREQGGAGADQRHALHERDRRAARRPGRRRCWTAIDLVTAATLEALRGALPGLRSARAPAAPARRPGRQRGQHRRRAERIERIAGPGSARLQDAYSLRCAAQVHGAAREAYRFFSELVHADLNAVTDNPLVFEDPPEVISAGNFHGQSLALAFDTLRLGLADLGSISERRTFRLLSPTLNGRLPDVPDHRRRDLERLHGRPVHRRGAGGRAARAGASGQRRHDPDLRQPGGSRLDGDDRGADGAWTPWTGSSAWWRSSCCAPVRRSTAIRATPVRAVGALHAAVRERVTLLTQDRPPADDLDGDPAADHATGLRAGIAGLVVGAILTAMSCVRPGRAAPAARQGPRRRALLRAARRR